MVPALTTSFNSGLAGLTFFAFREYIAGPILVETVPWRQYARRREIIRAVAAGRGIRASPNLTFSEIRMHKLLDTGVAGSATGSCLYLFKRGSKGVLQSAITAGIICTLAQLLWNELEVTRIKFVSHSRKSASETGTARQSVRTFSEKFMDGLGIFLPVKKLSDEEYLAKLLRRRDEVEKHLEEVRTDIENLSSTGQKRDE